jgi:hypothetical protein
MMLYGKDRLAKKKERPIRTLDLIIDELPKRSTPLLVRERERVKYIKRCEKMVRGSLEYKDCVKFLKQNMNMDKCAILKNVNRANNKKFSIELHHTPFTLFDIVDTVIRRREVLNESLNAQLVANEVTRLHYGEKDATNSIVGLVPLSATMHMLAHSGKVFIPLQYVYGAYDKFYEDYEPFINSKLKEKIELIADMSVRCGEIQSDILDPEFVYVNVDGWDFPSVPPEWGEFFKNMELT